VYFSPRTLPRLVLEALLLPLSIFIAFSVFLARNSSAAQNKDWPWSIYGI
jgi:hypothetical protein